MTFKSLITTTCACLTMVSFNTNAALIERLGGLAYYDNVADLTWLADANAAGINMNWNDANAWAASLDVAGVTGWRLPETLQPDAGCSLVDGNGQDYGTGCTGSEMGNLFYNVLGGVADVSILDTHNANYDLFSNVISASYWSSTEYEFNTGFAWIFGMPTGSQSFSTKSADYYAWAVYSGDVSPVPVPAAVWLFGSGLLGLVGVARRKKAS